MVSRVVSGADRSALLLVPSRWTTVPLNTNTTEVHTLSVCQLFSTITVKQFIQNRIAQRPEQMMATLEVGRHKAEGWNFQLRSQHAAAACSERSVP